MTNIEFYRSAIRPGDCIGGGWNVVTTRFGMYLGIGLLTLILIGCIPLVNLFLMGPVLGGFYYVVLRDMRGEPVDFGMMFKGFEKFVPLMVVGLIQSIPGIIFQIIQYTVDLARLAGLDRLSPVGRGDFYQASGPDVGILTGLSLVFILFVIGLSLFSIVWNLAFQFAVPLIIEHDLDVGEAIKLSISAALGNLGGMIVLIILECLVSILGVLAICVGFFVAVPVIYAANAFAYRQVFPLIERNFNMSPPPPTAYGSSFGSGM